MHSLTQIIHYIFNGMPFQSIQYPQYPGITLFLAYFNNVDPVTLSTVKSELVKRNAEYDYCFLSTSHIISMEQLHSSLHKSIQNHVNDCMKANTLNTEIILNLSPVNNINDALKRFGVDESRTDVIVIKAFETTQNTDFHALDAKLSSLLGAPSVELNDKVLGEVVDLKKFRKVFKLTEESLLAHESYTKGAIAASLLRGL